MTLLCHYLYCVECEVIVPQISVLILSWQRLSSHHIKESSLSAPASESERVLVGGIASTAARLTYTIRLSVLLLSYIHAGICAADLILPAIAQNINRVGGAVDAE